MPVIRWFTRYGPEGASSRYRAYQYLEGLASAGYGSEVEPLATWRSSRRSAMVGVAGRVRSLSGMGRRGSGGVVVIQKEPVMPPGIWRMVRPLVRKPGPIVWDVDDAVWIGASSAHAMACDMAAMADVAVAGNELIATWLRQHGAVDVRVIPTCFDARGPRQETADRDVVELVWVGSPATADRFRVEAQRFLDVLKSPRVQLTCVGAPAFELPAARPVRFVDWTPEVEHLALGRAHYGLSFLPRDEYSDHKCGFKLVQYLAYGVVPIATRSPVHEAIVGDVGHLVGPETDVRDLAETLTVRPGDSDREAARSRWEANFSVAAGTKAWAELLGELHQS